MQCGGWGAANPYLPYLFTAGNQLKTKLKRKKISKHAYKYELFQNALQTYGGKYVFFFKWAKRVLSNIVTFRVRGKRGRGA